MESREGFLGQFQTKSYHATTKAASWRLKFVNCVGQIKAGQKSISDHQVPQNPLGVASQLQSFCFAYTSHFCVRLIWLVTWQHHWLGPSALEEDHGSFLHLIRTQQLLHITSDNLNYEQPVLLAHVRGFKGRRLLGRRRSAFSRPGVIFLAGRNDSSCWCSNESYRAYNWFLWGGC